MEFLGAVALLVIILAIVGITQEIEVNFGTSISLLCGTIMTIVLLGGIVAYTISNNKYIDTVCVKDVTTKEVVGHYRGGKLVGVAWNDHDNHSVEAFYLEIQGWTCTPKGTK
jgi:hypothetical protein